MRIDIGAKNEYALRNINLEFSKDDFAVLVGYNGSGKSTLIKIIMGIYSDYEGDIFVNDINLRMLIWIIIGEGSA